MVRYDTCRHHEAGDVSLSNRFSRVSPPRSLAHSSLSAASGNDNAPRRRRVRHAGSCVATLGRVQLARQRSKPLLGRAIGYRYIHVYKTHEHSQPVRRIHTHIHTFDHNPISCATSLPPTTLLFLAFPTLPTSTSGVIGLTKRFPRTGTIPSPARRRGTVFSNRSRMTWVYQD